jgi:YlmC/YmxH family sporulation protein
MTHTPQRRGGIYASGGQGAARPLDPRAVTIRELCEKEVVQLEQGMCLGRADDLELDPATAQLQSLILLGRPRLFGLLGRDESLTIPWQEIETIGTDAILVHTAVPKAPAAPHGFWQQLRAKLGL